MKEVGSSLCSKSELDEEVSSSLFSPEINEKKNRFLEIEIEKKMEKEKEILRKKSLTAD